MMPAGLGAVDRGFENGRHARWPPLPFVVPYLNRFFFSRKHSDAWKFSPCTNFQRRELSFVSHDWRNLEAFRIKMEIPVGDEDL